MILEIHQVLCSDLPSLSDMH